MKKQLNEETKMPWANQRQYIYTVDEHVHHSPFAPRQWLLPRDACCLATWLAWPGVGGLQQAELCRAREHAWHCAQERAPEMEARGACLKQVFRTKEAGGGYWESRESQGEDTRGQWDKEDWAKHIGVDAQEGCLCQHRDHKYFICLAGLSFRFVFIFFNR